MDAWAIVIGAGDAKQAGQLAQGRSRRRCDRGPAGVRREADVEVGKGLALPLEAGMVEVFASGIGCLGAALGGERQEDEAQQAALRISDRITE